MSGVLSLVRQPPGRAVRKRSEGNPLLHGITGTALSHATHVVVAGAVAAMTGAGSASAASLLAPPAGKISALAQHASPGRPPTGRTAQTRHAEGRPARARRTSAGPASLVAAHHAAAHHGIVPNADRLMPVATSGPQSWTQISPAQYANAATIVRQTLANRMGIRSAVIAVATALQESKLLNLNYGTGDSLGLFQQQWDMGWGTPQQIMNPAYAADAFLKALRTYQASNPSWASQPLYQAAQGVQGSAFPYAYAQWEAQAAHLTYQVAMHRTR
jgi:hypothetical protein